MGTPDREEIMNNVRSRDGTTIAFDRSGGGPPVIVVGGAFNDRSTGRGPPCRRGCLEGQFHDVSPEVLAPVLAEFFAAETAAGRRTKEGVTL
jgi:hypothetical protein